MDVARKGTLLKFSKQAHTQDKEEGKKSEAPSP
jgi:hypothetical protein